MSAQLLADELEGVLKQGGFAWIEETSVIARVLTTLRAPGWQPIAEAPKDETRVLLARIGNNEVGKDLGVWWACTGHWSTKWKNWNDGIEPSGLANPTHYMPLPTPPNERAK